LNDLYERSPFKSNYETKPDRDSNLMSTMMETVPKGPHVLAVLRIEEEEKEDISMDEFKPETPKTKKMNSGIKI
jgi:hypothetical protein